MVEEKKVPKGYKQTEVGVVPEEWEVDEVGHLLQIKTGSKNTQDKKDDGQFPFFVRSDKVERINSYSFDGEGVLTAGDGVGTGKIFHYINGKCDIHQRVYLMHAFTDKIHARYFYIVFSANFYYRIMAMTAKSSVDSVRREMISKMPIPLPPFPEQKAIAEVLSDTDALIESLEALIAKKRAVKQGSMQELLTGRRRLPGFAVSGRYRQTEVGVVPEEWEVSLVKDLFTVEAGGDLERSSFRQEKDQIHPYPIYANALQCKGIYGYSSTWKYKENSITITARGTLGHAEHRREPFTAIVRLLVLTPQRLLECGFFTEYINSFVEIAVESTGVPQLTAPQLSNLYIPLPPLPEQKAIAEVLSDMDTEIEALEKKRDKYKKIKQGMMDQLLTGKVRLI
jgi:type I restriction enzyme S subunit